MHSTDETTSPYLLDPIDSAEADRLRDRGGTEYLADSSPGYPCRQCLRDADIGERLILVSHDPFDPETASPYRSNSPIFLHADPCGVPDDLRQVPEQLTVRQLSVRAFDDHAFMIDATTISGTDLDDTLRRFFADPSTAGVHVHNAARGCWATHVRRAR